MAFRSSITSSGTRRLMLVMGRSLRSRFWRRSFMLIVPPFRRCGRSGRNDADGVLVPDDMDDEQGSPILRKSDGGFPWLILIAGINQVDEGIEEDLTSLFKRDMVLAEVRGGLLRVPFKDLTLEFIGDIHQTKCIYIVDARQGAIASLRGSRVSRSRSKRPKGVTCPVKSGLRPARSRAVMVSSSAGSSRTS